MVTYVLVNKNQKYYFLITEKDNKRCLEETQELERSNSNWDFIQKKSKEYLNELYALFE